MSHHDEAKDSQMSKQAPEQEQGSQLSPGKSPGGYGDRQAIQEEEQGGDLGSVSQQEQDGSLQSSGQIDDSGQPMKQSEQTETKRSSDSYSTKENY